MRREIIKKCYESIPFIFSMSEGSLFTGKFSTYPGNPCVSSSINNAYAFEAGRSFSVNVPGNSNTASFQFSRSVDRKQ